MDTVFHEIEPIFNRDSKILILGSFPSVKSREGHFFYNHHKIGFGRCSQKFSTAKYLKQSKKRNNFC